MNEYVALPPSGALTLARKLVVALLLVLSGLVYATVAETHRSATWPLELFDKDPLPNNVVRDHTRGPLGVVKSSTLLIQDHVASQGSFEGFDLAAAMQARWPDLSLDGASLTLLGPETAVLTVPDGDACISASLAVGAGGTVERWLDRGACPRP